MGEVAVQVEGLGKKYRILHKQENSEDSLIDAFTGGIAKLFRPHESRTSEEFWAVRDMSFTVMQGERVGIIGRNGAGKSTLLKMLSRIVHPSTGRITYYGRMASLLEVGTGFHGDLTGRENIYLNGSILGMKRSEITARFDEIVAFSEVEQFLDTPVKKYSSGMYVRLAFAVAAHLDPEILVVDEVLAVGDAAFQKKCLNRMSEISREGKTLFFVSHNMAAVQHLCDRCLFLSNGTLTAFGNTADVIPEYLRVNATAARTDLAVRRDRSGNGKLRFSAFAMLDGNGNPAAAAQCGARHELELVVDAAADLSHVAVALGIDDGFGQRVVHCSNESTDQVFERLSAGRHVVRIVFPKFALKNGEYSFTLFATERGEIADWVQDAGRFTVEAGDFYGTGKLPPEGQASVYVDHSFILD